MPDYVAALQPREIVLNNGVLKRRGFHQFNFQYKQIIYHATMHYLADQIHIFTDQLNNNGLRRRKKVCKDKQRPGLFVLILATLQWVESVWLKSLV